MSASPSSSSSSSSEKLPLSSFEIKNNKLTSRSSPSSSSSPSSALSISKLNSVRMSTNDERNKQNSFDVKRRQRQPLSKNSKSTPRRKKAETDNDKQKYSSPKRSRVKKIGHDADRQQRQEINRESFNSIGKPIIRVIVPILIALLAMLFLVTISCADSPDACYHGEFAGMATLVPLLEQPEQPFWTRLENAAIAAGCVVAVIAVMSFVIAAIFYCGAMWVMTAYVFVAMFMAFMLFGATFVKSLFRYFDLPIDVFTGALLTWNFAAIGLIIFFLSGGPKLLKSAYLIFLSASISVHILILLPPFTTWALLILLVLWDLFAVLTPCGPLKMIVDMMHESERREQNEAEMLTKSSSPSSSKSHLPHRERIVMKRPKKETAKFRLPEVMLYSTMAYIVEMARADRKKIEKNADDNLHHQNNHDNVIVNPNDDEVDHDQNDVYDPDDDRNRNRNRNVGNVRYGKKISELRPQLGLGDFIFYSLLVGKTATMTTSIVTILAVTIAILVGLISTLMLLMLMRRALPALPISLTLALIVLPIVHNCAEPFFDRLNVNMIFV